MQKILLLEDDRLLAQTLQELLTSEGYLTTLATTFTQAADLTYTEKFDLYIFDINLPDGTGLELLASLRNAEDRTPTIFISALVDLDTMTKAFSIGAGDYVKKPFFPEELLLRVNAKLQLEQSEITYKHISLNPKTKIVQIAEVKHALGEVQTKLLELFLTNRGKVLDNALLMDALENPSPTALRVALTKLKQTTALEIKNLRGIGYILE
jgi:DNA-binding response OmpR family regulator